MSVCARAPRRRDDRGISLPELLVAMAVSSVVLIAVATTFTTSLNLTREVSSRTGALSDARVAMDTAARRLRVAVRPPAAASMVVAASSDSLSFYASLAPTGTYPSVAPDGSTTTLPPTLVEYSIDATSGCFREALTSATVTTAASGAVSYTWPAANRRSRCLVFGRVDASGSPLFTFYETGSTGTALALGAAPPTTLDLVRSVGITMTVRDKAGSTVKPTQVQTRVSLANRLSEDETGRTS